MAAVPWPPGHGALAQGTGKTPVIVVINYAQAIHESKAGQSLRKQFDKQRAVYEKEIKKAETQLEEAQQELKQQQAVLSPEAFARKRQEFQQQAGELQRRAQDRRRSLDQMRDDGLRQIETVLREILGEMVKERGYDIVMNAGPGTGTIVIANKDLFITGEVMERLDKKLPSVTAKPAE
ncbi:MAG: OmpH family outer membrane protein [Alphaproteobacteria bacterium]|nr:OmpH family outer membrane protein [Alphaproteobacteria bacterium]